MHPQLATSSLAIHLHHPSPVGKTGRYYCCSHIKSINCGKQLNILWSNPWISGFVCYAYLLTKPKKVSCLCSCSFNWGSQRGLPIPLSRLLLFSQICIELQNPYWSVRKGKVQVNCTLYWLATVLCRKCNDEAAQRNNPLIVLLELNVTNRGKKSNRCWVF